MSRPYRLHNTRPGHATVLQAETGRHLGTVDRVTDLYTGVTAWEATVTAGLEAGPIEGRFGSRDAAARAILERFEVRP